jgi:DNA-binding transcriptional regulator YiaG
MRLGVSVESCRAWDSGRRIVPLAMQQRAARVHADLLARHEWLPLGQLAREFGVHVSTLQAAIRSGRLPARFDSRSVFGRPARRATRAAIAEFLRCGYRQRARASGNSAPLVTVPADYDLRLRRLRRSLRLTQAELARRIGAAGKAVVYQWESRKRSPSPVLWRHIKRLGPRLLRTDACR